MTYFYSVDGIKCLSRIKDVEELYPLLRKQLGNNVEILETEIIRESIDGRKRPPLWNYTLNIKVNRRLRGRGIHPYIERKYELPKSGKASLSSRPVIVGFGPAGMMCALILAEAGYAPIVLERGRDIDRRVKDVEKYWKTGVVDPCSNVQFGAGGAGTFSDGKLNTGVNNPLNFKVIQEFIEAGAPKDIAYFYKPHIGTDLLRNVVKNIHAKIKRLGGSILYENKLTHLKIKDGRIMSISGEGSFFDKRSDFTAASKENLQVLDEKNDDVKVDVTSEKLVNINELKPPYTVILCPGHSARDTIRSMHDSGILIKPKKFSMGIRIEHDQAIIDKNQYGFDMTDDRYEAGGFSAASYKMSCKTEDGRGVYTFCMCPGGEIVMSASDEKQAVVNGMSNRNRDSGRANSAILCDVYVEDYINEMIHDNYTDECNFKTTSSLREGDDLKNALLGIAFQEKYEALAYERGGGSGFPPECTFEDFCQRNTSGNNVRESLPAFVARPLIEGIRYFGSRIEGFDAPDSRLVAIESRSSSPVSFPRDVSLLNGIDYMGNSIKGFYPGGEGTGHGGGIMSAAMDGIKIAESIISEYAPYDEC